MRRRGNGRKEPKRFKNFMKHKLLFVFFLIILLMCGLVGRLIYLNNTDGQRYAKRVLSQQSYVSTALPYQRGSILDRNGTVLATSKKVYNIIFDPKVLLTDPRNVDDTLAAICQVFTDVTDAELRSILDKNPDSSYYVLRKKQEYELVSQFEELQKASKKIKGVWFEEEYERIYPYDSLASHVIGYTSAGDVGTWGIEQNYNSALNGTNGRIYGYFDAELNLKRTVKPAVNGNTIISTIDTAVQQLVEQHIDQFMEEVGADNVGIIVSNPNNGQIYAMANNHSFNLNDPFDLSKYYSEVEIASMTEEEKMNARNHMWRNFCISDAYEPGSTFKPFTVAAGLEENVVTPDSTFLCKGVELVADRRIRCNATHGQVTLAQSLMKSCNPAMMEIGKRLGPEEFCIYQDHFNFGKKTGIDLPGEAYGLLYDASKMRTVELATNSFGQTFTVTMTQMVAGFSSLINGGYYYQPTVVKEIIDDRGNVVDAKEPVVVNETVSAKTSEFLREALYLTVQEGTAKPAQVPGYLVGGKTGTAQKLPRGNGKYVVSFIGCVPTDDPQVVIYVVIDTAHDPERVASSALATTLASQILKDILPLLDVYPEGDIEYRVDLPMKEEQPLVDEDGNPIEPEEPGFTDSEAPALPNDLDNMPEDTHQNEEDEESEN